MTVLGRVAIAMVILSSLWIGVTAVWMGVHGWSPTPYQDLWDATTAAQIDGRLFAPHNEHRIVVTRLIVRLDILIGQTSGIVSTVFVYAFNFGHWALLVLLARWTWPASAWWKFATAACVAFAFFFSGFQYENYISGFQNQFTGVFFFGAGSIVALAFASGQKLVSRICLIVLSFVMALVAVGCMASGLLLLLVLPIVAFFLGMRLSMVGFAIAAAIIWRFYLDGQPTVGASSLGDLVTAPVGFFSNFLAYLGGSIPNSMATLQPLEASKLFLARIFGAIALGGSLSILSLVFRRKERARPQVVAWMGLIGFLLLVGVAIAVGRASQDTTMLSNRYGAATAGLWAILTFWLILPANSWRVPAGLGAAGLTLSFLAATQFVWFGAVQVVKDRRVEAEAALLVSADVPAVYRAIYPSPQTPKTVAATMRKTAMGMFAAPWSRLWGETLAGSTSNVCGASVGPTRALVGTVDPTWRAAVRGLFPGNTRALAVMSPDQRVVGLLIRGMPGDPARTVTGWIRHAPQWSGFIRVPANSSVLRLAVIAIDEGGTPLCTLDKAIEVDGRRHLRAAPIGELDKPLIEDSVITTSGAFQEGGQDVSRATPPIGERSWGSHAGSDANTGSIRITFRVDKTRTIALPIVTGPDPKGTRFEIKANGVSVMQEADVEGLADWVVIQIDLPEATETVEIVAVDASTSWGGWIAIGEPWAMCDGACAAVVSGCPSASEITPSAIADIAGQVDKIALSEQGLIYEGWAADRRTNNSAPLIVAMRGSVVLACASPSLPRDDVAKAEKAPGLALSGFSFVVPSRFAMGVEVLARQADGTFLALGQPEGAATNPR